MWYRYWSMVWRVILELNYSCIIFDNMALITPMFIHETCNKYLSCSLFQDFELSILKAYLSIDFAYYFSVKHFKQVNLEFSFSLLMIYSAKKLLLILKIVCIALVSLNFLFKVLNANICIICGILNLKWRLVSG